MNDSADLGVTDRSIPVENDDVSRAVCMMCV